MAIISFYDLVVWQLSMELAEELYGFIRSLPKEELYGLSDQMKRAVISIPSNIAEGQKRCNPKEFKHFLYYSRGSLGELITQLNLCNRFGYLSDEKLDIFVNKCELIDKKINNLIKSLPEKISHTHKSNSSNSSNQQKRHTKTRISKNNKKDSRQ